MCEGTVAKLLVVDDRADNRILNHLKQAGVHLIA